MQTRHSSQDTPSRWKRWWPLFLLAIVVPVITYLVWRPKGEEPDPGEQDESAVAGKPKYQNRGVWQGEGGPRARVPAVKGTVYDEAGRPIEGVVVTATTFALAGNQNHLAGRAKTDFGGKFELALPDGSYYLNADKEGYGSTLAMAHSGDEVGMVLLDSGAAEGKVTNERGEPVTRFSIDVIGPSTDDMAAPAPFVSKRFESADGSFKITQLPDRVMYLRVTAEGHAPAYSEAMKPEPGVTQRADLVMNTGCILTGVVEDEDGRPLMDAFVDAELRRSAGVIGDTSLDAASKDVTANDGAFRLANVPLGNILIQAYQQDHAPAMQLIQIERCEDVQPIRLRMGAGGSLTGVVRDARGNPVFGAKLTLMNRTVGFVNTKSDREGRYRFDRLPPGVMRVEAQRGQERAVAPVMVEAGKAAERDLKFSRKGDGTIEGRVLANGKPLPGIQLLIAKSAGEGLMNMYFPVTDGEGRYRVSGLTGGMYAVLITSMNQVSSARIENGEPATVDFEVTKRPVAQAVPEPHMDDEEHPM